MTAVSEEMLYPYRLLVVFAAAILAGCATNNSSTPAPAVASRAEVKPLDEARLNEAKMLKAERRYLEAAAIYAEQSKLQPQNAELVARQAHLLSSQAREESDPVKAKALYKQARVLAERAEKLGTTDPLTPLILASVRPDGSTEPTVAGAFSKHEEADKCIREGEAAFTRHDFARARECYQQAFALEPTSYVAALWTGDTFLAAGQFEPACEWYRKAIAVDPDNETGHRYLGDALAKLGRREEALNEWIVALLCEPYQRLTRQHFTEALRAPAEARGRTIPRFPAMRSTAEGKKINLAVDPDDGLLLMAYNICAVGWRVKDFSERYPQEQRPRRSLLEEVSAIGGMLEVAESAKADASGKSAEAHLEKWQPVMDGLAVLKREGLLEAYVLFERYDAELAKDYVAYRAAHRDKLERYLRVYWCGFE